MNFYCENCRSYSHDTELCPHTDEAKAIRKALHEDTGE